MIKLDTKEWKVETDCKTVGEFMTEAASFWPSVKVTINDGDEYFFEGGQKVKVVDNTPIEKVLFDRADYTLNARASFIVITKPKPKTVRKSGWVNIFKHKETKPFPAGFIYDDKKQCESDEAYLHCNGLFLAFAKIEWEEKI